MTSSIYAIFDTTPTATAIPLNTDIFANDVVITAAMIKPGGGSVLRLYLSFTMGATGHVRVFNNSVVKGILNIDNNSGDIISNGYYRFDIDIEEDDIINIQSDDQVITEVNTLRAHLVQFGAWLDLCTFASTRRSLN